MATNKIRGYMTLFIYNLKKYGIFKGWHLGIKICTIFKCWPLGRTICTK